MNIYHGKVTWPATASDVNLWNIFQNFVLPANLREDTPVKCNDDNLYIGF